MTEAQLTALYATVLGVIRRNVSSKWGHPKYSCRVGSSELRKICDGAVALIRERREVERPEPAYSVEELDALTRIRNELRNSERRSPDIMYYSAHLVEARKALDKLLAREVGK